MIVGIAREMMSRRARKELVVPEGLSEPDLKEILSAFDALDVNKDGSISKKEMKDAARMTGMNPTDKEVEEWWKAADANGDGNVSLQEYVNIMADNYVTIDLEQERMETAFKVIDKNGDGQISLQEFRAVMTFNNMFSKDEVDKLFKEVDTKGKGYIDYNDFIKNRMYEVLF